jgi:hypothetical protein
MDNNQKVKFNNKEYEWNKLSQKAKLYFGQLRDLETKIMQSRMQMDQLNMSKHGFTMALQTELTGPSKPAPTVKVNYGQPKIKDEKEIN